MKIFRKKTTWTGAGVAAALVAGAPVLADDTELLLINPDPSQAPKPNVMFILDSSGSMDTEESTVEPYDSTVEYSGDCDRDAMYWTDVDLVPSCTPGNEQWVYKTAYQCEFADRQIEGIGSFTNTMIQFRDDDGVADADLSDDSWNYVEPGNHDAPVECRSDSGTHGDGTAGLVYAAAGTGTAWTSDPNKEVGWGSAPRNLSYTFYDGNYLNWKANPTTVTLERTDIMKIVTKTVLNSVNNMNVGLMRFNGSNGGTVLTAIKDLDTNRADILATIDTIPAAGNTPLSETLYESARYWTGGIRDFANATLTDPAALVSGLTPATYKQPELGSCSKNYNVLITDGVPVSDDDGPGKAALLPGWNTIMPGGCVGSGQGHCLDEISEYLGKVDTADNVDGTQTVTTHTIGFTIDLDILEDTAEASGGQYFLADDIESLTIALLRIVGEINDRSLSFSAPAVSVNTFNRTRNLNDLYLTVFGARNKAHWPGNLKKYGINDGVIVDADGFDAVDPNDGFFYDTARSIWTVGGDDGKDVRLGGAARRLPDPAVRNLFTNNGSSNSLSNDSNKLSTAFSASYTLADFGLTGATGEPTIDEMIDWMRGVDVRDEDGNTGTTIRYAMGDPLHSRPAAIVYGGTEADPDVVVFTATNDGYVHAIDGDTGVELWSFVPKQLLPNMARLFFDPSAKFKQYGVDGNIVPIVKDVDSDGVIESGDGDFVHIIFGMRRGGTTYFALDVTDKNAPDLMWTKTLDDGGQSWSTPVVTRMNIDVGGINADKAVVVIGGGYDPVHDTAEHPSSPDGVGAGLHILDLKSGATLWRAGADSGATKKFDGISNTPVMNRAFPTEARVIDLNGDRFADRMYAVDISGQVWRFDIISGEDPADLVDGGIIAQLGAEGLSGTPTAADTRRFYNAPDLSIFRDPITGQRFISVAVGSGYRARPFDTSAADRFYSLRDPAVFNALPQSAYNSYDIIEESDLVEVSGSVKNVIGASSRGWKFTLRGDEKVLASSVTFDDEIFFVSFDPNAIGAEDCGTGQGTNYLYRVSVVNGDPIVNNLDAVTPALADEARRTTLKQGGIAPTPTILFTSPDQNTCTGAGCKTKDVMCIGVECFSPGFNNNPVRTLWTQDGIE